MVSTLYPELKRNHNSTVFQPTWLCSKAMNRYSKTKGGIIGVSNDVQAVEKWTLTSHLRADILMR